MTNITSRTVTTAQGQAEVFIPTRNDVDDLRVGDLVPYCMGIGVVSRVFAGGEDKDGRMFICFYVRTGQASEISASLKEGEAVRSLELIGTFNSAQIDEIERLAREV